MTEKLPDEFSDRDMVQLLSAQEVLMDNRDLHKEYLQKVKKNCERYGVEVPRQVKQELGS